MDFVPNFHKILHYWASHNKIDANSHRDTCDYKSLVKANVSVMNVSLVLIHARIVNTTVIAVIRTAEISTTFSVISDLITEINNGKHAAHNSNIQ